MSQPEGGFWIFIALCWLFAVFNILDVYVCEEESNFSGYPFAWLSLTCLFIAFLFHWLAGGVP